MESPWTSMDHWIGLDGGIDGAAMDVHGKSIGPLVEFVIHDVGCPWIVLGHPDKVA